jgi:phosphohistidine phosphatase
MKLYLVQHGKAASEQADPQRPLTEEGRIDVQKIAEFVKPLGLCVDYLWHSGKKRAVQTAEVLAEAVKVKKAETTRDGLGPNDDITVIRDELVSLQQDIMIVGHLPFLSKLTSLLLAGNELADTVAFKNAGIVCLKRSEDEQWQIDWVITPEILA